MQWCRSYSCIHLILKCASRRLYLIRRLRDFMDCENLARVYHAIITSIFLYASPVYGRLPLTLSAKLENFQRRAHRLVCGPYCECERFPSVSCMLQDAAKRLLLQSEANPNHPLHPLVPERLPASNRLRMPVCRTDRRLHSFVPWSTRLLNSLF